MSGKTCPSKKYSRDSRMEYPRESHREVVKPKEQHVQLIPFLSRVGSSPGQRAMEDIGTGNFVLSGLALWFTDVG